MGYFLTQVCRLSETVILSVGAHLTTTVGGVFFFGLPVTFSAAAYTTVIAQRQGLSFGLAVAMGLVASVLLGGLFTLAYCKLSADSFAVFTLISILAFDAVLKSWTSVTGGVLGLTGVQRPSFATTLGAITWLQVGFATAVLGSEYLILKSWLGRALQGLRENGFIVQSLGVSVRQVVGAVLIISSAFSGVAGLLAVWRIRFLDPSFVGLPLLLQMLTIAIIAARPKVRWVALSTLFIVLLPEVLRFVDLPSSMVGQLRVLIYAGALIIILKNLKRFMPQRRFI